MSEQTVEQTVEQKKPAARRTAEPTNRFKINNGLLPFSEAIFALPKSIKPKPFTDGGGGQIQIVTGALRLGASLTWLPFGVALRWAGDDRSKFTPAVQLPKLASNRFDAAIKTDDVATKAALDIFERDLAAAAVAYYKSEIKRSEKNVGSKVIQSTAVQTFKASDLGFTFDDEQPKAKRQAKSNVPAAPDADDDDGDE